MDITTKACIVFAGIALITWWSRGSLKNRNTHGYPRYFAFILILMILINVIDVWFDNPFSWNQIISWLFLFESIVLALQGFLSLRGRGKPESNFETTTVLLTDGIYRYIRHPMYASLLALMAGIYFKEVSLRAGFIGILVAYFLNRTATIEERENKEKFGAAYEAYMTQTKRFIPYVY